MSENNQNGTKTGLRAFYARFSATMNMRWVLILLLLPVAALLGFVIIEWVVTVNRYDPAYFTPELEERYNHPQDTVAAAAAAIVAGDEAVLTEAEGLLRPVIPSQVADLRYVFPYEVYRGHRRLIVTEDPNVWAILASPHNRFVSYMYANPSTGDLIKFMAEPVSGRWVYVPDGLYTYMRTGAWVGLWGTLTPIYALLLVLGLAWTYMERRRKARAMALWGRERR
jgi:hypothetical protein